jgi:uncharacterized protein YbaP (TraB family)
MITNLDIFRALVTLALSFLASSALAEPALWAAKQGGATVYLFGTVHALKSDTQWWTPKIATAFDRSEELWIESEDDPVAVKALVVELGYDRRHPLSTKLTPTDVMRLEAAANAAGLPGEPALDGMEPWYAALTLSVEQRLRAGYEPANGADEKLKAMAAAAGKPVHAFETATQQINYFATLQRAVAVSLLHEMLDEKDPSRMIGASVEAWLKGDLEAIDKGLNSFRTHPDVYATIILNRSSNWVERKHG